MARPNWGIVALIAAVCAFAGGVLGFIIGVATSEFGKELVGTIDVVEEDADVENPTSVDRAWFGFQYPGNWSLDEETSYYDPDHYISIDSPGGAYIVVEVDDLATDSDVKLQAELAEWQEYLSNPQNTFFDSYGSYRGSGVSISDRSFAGGEQYRIFCYSDGERTVTISEYYWEPDRALVEPGFKLIERTMELK